MTATNLDKLDPAERYMVEHARKHGGNEYSEWVKLADRLAPKPEQQSAQDALTEEVCRRMHLTAPLEQSFAEAVVFALLQAQREQAP